VSLTTFEAVGTHLEAKNTPYKSIKELTEGTASYVFLIHPSDASFIIKPAEPSVKVIAVVEQALRFIPKSVLPRCQSRFSVRGTISLRSQGQGLGQMAVGLLRTSKKGERVRILFKPISSGMGLGSATVRSAMAAG
jgi:hypothetical protein